MNREEAIQKIIDTVAEAHQHNYSDLVLKMDLDKILEEVESDIAEYNYDVIEDLRTSYRNNDSDGYCFYGDVLDLVRDSLY